MFDAAFSELGAIPSGIFFRFQHLNYEEEKSRRKQRRRRRKGLEEQNIEEEGTTYAAGEF